MGHLIQSLPGVGGGGCWWGEEAGERTWPVATSRLGATGEKGIGPGGGKAPSSDLAWGPEAGAEGWGELHSRVEGPSTS